MKKSEKRRIGEARQAENLKESLESGLRAQRQAHRAAAKRKETLEKIAAKESARLEAILKKEKVKLGINDVASANKKPAKPVSDMTRHEFEETYPLVLDMTDETANA
jgi:septal ring factor EnvC (AmiA/AmiB activator)